MYEIPRIQWVNNSLNTDFIQQILNKQLLSTKHSARYSAIFMNHFLRYFHSVENPNSEVQIHKMSYFILQEKEEYTKGKKEKVLR